MIDIIHQYEEAERQEAEATSIQSGAAILDVTIPHKGGFEIELTDVFIDFQFAFDPDGDIDWIAAKMFATKDGHTAACFVEIDKRHWLHDPLREHIGDNFTFERPDAIPFCPKKEWGTI